MPRAPRGTFLAAAAMASFIGCRLRSLKPSKPSNSSKSLPNSAGKRHPNKPNTPTPACKTPNWASLCCIGRSSLPFASLQTLKTLKPRCLHRNAPNPRHVRPAPQGKGTPTSPTRATPACKTPNFAGKPLLLGRSSLPFASLQTLKTLKMPRRPFACIVLCFTPSTSAQRLSGKASSNKPTTWPTLAGPLLPALQPAVCLHIASVVRAFKPAVCQPSNP